MFKLTLKFQCRRWALMICNIESESQIAQRNQNARDRGEAKKKEHECLVTTILQFRCQHGFPSDMSPHHPHHYSVTASLRVITLLFIP
jgi:hypothetical protein